MRYTIKHTGTGMCLRRKWHENHKLGMASISCEEAKKFVYRLTLSGLVEEKYGGCIRNGNDGFVYLKDGINECEKDGAKVRVEGEKIKHEDLCLVPVSNKTEEDINLVFSSDCGSPMSKFKLDTGKQINLCFSI